MRRFFLLSQELEAAKGQVFKPEHAGYPEFVLAQQAWESAQSLLDVAERHDTALLMLRDALDLAVHARLLRNAAAEPADRAEQWTAFEALESSRSALEPLSAEQRELARQAFVDGDNLRVVKVPPAERSKWSAALVRLVPALLDGLQKEADRVALVRGKRALRIGGAAAAVLAVIVALFAVKAAFLTRVDLALHKRVAISSNYDARSFPAASAVDGNTAVLGCHTQRQNRPWLRIDLGSVVKVHEVVVFNRTTHAERVLPLLIEVSPDGKHYQPFARRTEHFTVWHAKGDTTRARYVRLTVERNSWLHVNEVQVF